MAYDLSKGPTVVVVAAVNSSVQGRNGGHARGIVLNQSQGFCLARVSCVLVFFV